MNNKIKELAEQAKFAINVSDDPNSPPYWWAAGHNNIFEKFAELIVRECADAAEEAVSHAIFNTTMHDNDIPNYVRAKVEDIWKQTVQFGDKTLLANPSALDRINVRRLSSFLKKATANEQQD